MNHKRQTRETLCDKIMNEVTIYGGLPMRRADVYILAREHQGDYRGRFGTDYIAFVHKTVDVEPWPIDQAREIMK